MPFKQAASLTFSALPLRFWISRWIAVYSLPPHYKQTVLPTELYLF